MKVIFTKHFTGHGYFPISELTYYSKTHSSPKGLCIRLLGLGVTITWGERK